MNDTALTHRTEETPEAPFAIPAIDILEGDRDFRVDVDLPGVGPEDVQVRLDGRELMVEATRSGDRAVDGQTLRYRRSVRFDVPLDVDAVTAQLDSGVLALTLPKASEALPRQIPVVAG